MPCVSKIVIILENTNQLVIIFAINVAYYINFLISNDYYSLFPTT